MWLTWRAVGIYLDEFRRLQSVFVFVFESALSFYFHAKIITSEQYQLTGFYFPSEVCSNFIAWKRKTESKCICHWILGWIHLTLVIYLSHMHLCSSDSKKSIRMNNSWPKIGIFVLKQNHQVKWKWLFVNWTFTVHSIMVCMLVRIRYIFYLLDA